MLLFILMIKLHLGCGKKDFGEDWIHIDGSRYPHVKNHDIVNLPFDENSVDLIYASHVFEYFDRDEAIDVLEKWKKVLKPGGILRLAVPDFEACAKLYVAKKEPLSKFVGMFYGKWNINVNQLNSEVESLHSNDKSENNIVYHKTIYDFDSLEKVLNDNGFREVIRWDWRNVDHGKIDDYSQAYLPHMDKDNGTLVSLNVECKKI